MACVSAALRQIKKSRVSHSDSDFSISTHCRETAADTRIISENFNKWACPRCDGYDSRFNGASSFNQPLNKWDVSKVTGMGDMFSGATSFNQPLRSLVPRRVRIGMTGSTFWSGDLAICDLAIS